jgi:sec-independent protein translocase protein TatB
MDIFGIGGLELLVIMLLAVIVLGPERLARVAREAGKLVRNFKAYFSALNDELKSELDVLDELEGVKRDLKGVKQDLDKTL